MMKSLRLLWAQAEDLPTPLAARLHLSGSNRMRVLAFHKPCEVPCDTPFTLKFYSSGELIGVIRVATNAVDCLERRWIPLEMGEIEVSWGEFGGSECSGPRVQLTLEPMRPLSPILELTEANECSVTDCTPTSPEGDQLREVIESLQREREVSSATLKDLQLKVMELQQALVKERWENRVSVEQLEVKHKGEASQLMLALDKAKGLQKKEAALNEALAGKLTEAEDKLAELRAKTDPETVVLKATIDQLEESLGKKSLEAAQIAGKLPILEHRNSTLEIQLKTSESRLATASAQLSTLRTEHETLLSASQLLSNELNSTKYALKQALDGSQVSQSEGKKSFAVSFLEAEKATMVQQMQEMQRTVGKLKNDLAEAVAENEKKERDLRNSTTLVDSLKAKLQAYDTTIKVLKASATVSLEAADPVDEALRDYLRGRKGLVPFVKLAEGVYSYGQQQVQISVKQGEIVVRTKRESLAIEEFLGTAEGRERSHSRHRSTSRPRSVDMDREWQHYRTMSNFIDLAKQGEVSFDQSSTQRVHTDICEYGTERLSRPLLAQRDTTPKREYLKQTISSTLKTTGKSQTPRPKLKSRIMKM